MEKAFPRFVLLLLAAAGFIWLSSRSMPDLVASHFEADGFANGFMRRNAYVMFMLAFAIGLPAVVAAASFGAVGRPNVRINLPNGDYWLAPERRSETVAYLRAHMMRFNSVLVVFLCYAHWLVLRANDVQPARMDATWMIGGLGVFGTFAVVWTRALWRRFRAPQAHRER